MTISLHLTYQMHSSLFKTSSSTEIVNWTTSGSYSEDMWNHGANYLQWIRPFISTEETFPISFDGSIKFNLYYKSTYSAGYLRKEKRKETLKYNCTELNPS